MLQPVKKRSRHVLTQLCTPDGECIIMTCAVLIHIHTHTRTQDRCKRRYIPRPNMGMSFLCSLHVYTYVALVSTFAEEYTKQSISNINSKEYSTATCLANHTLHNNKEKGAKITWAINFVYSCYTYIHVCSVGICMDAVGKAAGAICCLTITQDKHDLCQ